MSQFSEVLKSLISASGISIYKLAKDAGVDRTLIHKALTDERMPSAEFVAKVSDALLLSPFEKRELQKSYEIKKIGVHRYTQRSQVKQLIELIAQTENERRICTQNGALTPDQLIPLYEFADDAEKVQYGHYAINNLIRCVIEHESIKNRDSRIDFFVPSGFGFLFDELSISSMRKPALNIRHITALHKKSSYPVQSSASNIAALMNIIKLAYLGGTGYSPYYFYAETEGFYTMAPMPYYILTSTHLVTLNATLDAAILYRSADVMKYYANLFQETMRHATPFLKRADNFLDIISYYLLIDRRDNSGKTCLIGAQPCLGHYITEELTEKKLIQGLDRREEIKALAKKHYANLQKIAVANSGLFSIAGLEYLLKTGYITDVPSSYVHPLDRREIGDLISQFLADTRNGRFASFAIDPSKFTIPMFTSLLVDKLSGIHILTYSDVDLNALFINEPSIVEAFEDFCDSIEGSDLVYSQEETIEILENFLMRL